MIHQQHELLSAGRGQLQTSCNAMSEESASFRVRTRSHAFSRVMQEQRQVENDWIGQLLKEFPILQQLRVFGGDQGIEFLNADQRVFIRRIAVKKLMLNQTGELTKLRNIATEKIHPMHHAQGVSHFTFARKDLDEAFSRLFCVPVSALDATCCPAEALDNFRTQLQFAFLRVLKTFADLDQVSTEEIWTLCVGLTLAAVDLAKLFLVPFPARQKREEQSHARCGCAGGELLRQSFSDAKNIPRMLVVIFHERLIAADRRFLRITEPLRDLGLLMQA